MKLTMAIGEQFLWVDSLCIIQDDPRDKVDYIPRMDAIYGHSILTIIAACGKSAQSGLSGMRPGSRLHVQSSFSVKGISFVQTLDPVTAKSIEYLTESSWNSRGWTLQEGLLSPRTLIFTPEQVYWQCGGASWCEDGFWEVECSRPIYRHGLVTEFGNLWCSKAGHAEERYRQLVQIYSQRILTEESDGLAAFKGILNAFELHYGLQFFWALPEKYFGAALTWPTEAGDSEIRRRTGLCISNDAHGNVVESPFPSWSWVGWVGKIDFEGCFGKLTPPHANLVFYRINKKGEVKMILQHSNFKEQPENARFVRGEIQPASPTWKEVMRTEITKSDIPAKFLQPGISSIILAFWSSVAVVTLQYSHARSAEGLDSWRTSPKIMQLGRQIEALCGQIPRYQPEMDFEPVRLVVIGRHTLWSSPRKGYLSVMVTNFETDEGLTYRRALVTISEEVWNGLQRSWEKIILA